MWRYTASYVRASLIKRYPPSNFQVPTFSRDLTQLVVIKIFALNLVAVSLRHVNIDLVIRKLSSPYNVLMPENIRKSIIEINIQIDVKYCEIS